MKCNRAQELFSDDLEGTLERPMAVAFERHLAECPDCEHDYAGFKATWEMLDTLPAVEAPPSFAPGVVMAVQMQREAAQRTKPRWQVIWSDLFTTRVPARVFAAAVAIFLVVQIVLNTPLRGIVSAWIVGARPAGISNTAPMKWQMKAPAEAWLDSALTFDLAGSRDASDRSIFRLRLRPVDVTSKRVRVYLMPSGRPHFDQSGLDRASVIFDDDIGESGRVIPFVMGASSGRQDVLTALVEWKHRQRTFLEAVFVPVQMESEGRLITGDIRLRGEELYSALQRVSGTFGVVILAHADVNAAVRDVDVRNGTADDALYRITKETGLRWRPLTSQVYVVERRIE